MFHVQHMLHRPVEPGQHWRSPLLRAAWYRRPPLAFSVVSGIENSTCVWRCVLEPLDLSPPMLAISGRLKTWMWKLIRKPKPEPNPGKLIRYSKPYLDGEPLAKSTPKPTPDTEPPHVAARSVRKPVPKLKPHPMAQAQALFGWLQERYGGNFLKASEIESICYPQLLKEKGWREQPWVGRHGVGKYLTALSGGRKFYRYWVDEYGDKERVRTYLIPLAAAARKRA